MSQSMVPRRTVRGILIACAAALAGLMFLPMGIVPVFLQVILFQSALIAWLYIYSGWIASAILAVGLSTTAFIYVGSVGVACALFAVLLPACAAIYVNSQNLPFKLSLQICVGASLCGGLLAVGATRLIVGMDVADALSAALRSLAGYMPKEQMDMLFGMFAQAGLLSVEEAAAVTSGNMTQELQARIIAQFSEMYRATAVYDFPAELMAGSAVAGLFSVVWPRSAMRRLGYSDPAPYEPLSNWRLSDNMVYGLLTAWVAAWIARMVYPASGLIIQYAINRILMLALSIQGMAILDKQWKMGSLRRGARTAFLVLMYLFVRIALALTGGFWLMFGPDGMFTRFKKNMQDREGR